MLGRGLDEMTCGWEFMSGCGTNADGRNLRRCTESLSNSAVKVTQDLERCAYMVERSELVVTGGGRSALNVDSVDTQRAREPDFTPIRRGITSRAHLKATGERLRRTWWFSIPCIFRLAPAAVKLDGGPKGTKAGKNLEEVILGAPNVRR